MIDAVVLCGGLGTRLRSVIQDIPKPMAPINGRPFLEFVLKELVESKIVSSIVLCVGYKFEHIVNHFKGSFMGIPVRYSIEKEPLGTGGAIANALGLVETDSFLMLNGDTFFDIDYSKFLEFYKKNNSDISIALKEMKNFDRYGTVVCKNKSITEFKEKRVMDSGLINGGIYIVSKTVFSNNSLPIKFSFEKDILERLVSSIKMCGTEFSGFFIDIGIPEDYELASKFLK